MKKEEKIQAIYEEIAEGIYDSYLEDETIFPVMIGDVLDYLDKNFDKGNVLNIKINFLLSYWKEKKKPIEEQSEETIDYVFNLLPKE